MYSKISWWDLLQESILYNIFWANLLSYYYKLDHFLSDYHIPIALKRPSLQKEWLNLHQNVLIGLAPGVYHTIEEHSIRLVSYSYFIFFVTYKWAQ